MFSTPRRICWEEKPKALLESDRPRHWRSFCLKIRGNKCNPVGIISLMRKRSDLSSRDHNCVVMAHDLTFSEPCLHTANEDCAGSCGQPGRWWEMSSSWKPSRTLNTQNAYYLEKIHRMLIIYKKIPVNVTPPAAVIGESLTEFFHLQFLVEPGVCSL